MKNENGNSESAEPDQRREEPIPAARWDARGVLRRVALEALGRRVPDELQEALK